ncbi:methyl-accepting chemotaxis protein [Thalassotalea insulae]|uniref:Methyl-accepting chemotaxis protein n=1 Tax=Thalassotalea insulae TaxID=2056778 RepID=A0ABQ6GPD3_9GAMM|nr:methyl-accepting chemotaxis protein [Thalassotalea insulae]GLX77850.1 methyl-accepting chemotaxis protein [Thalassotalea insulae]
MKIKTKLILQAIFLAIVPATTLALIITLQANQASFAALEQKSKEQLISLREMKKAQITDYIAQIEAQIATFSTNLSVIDAANEFTASFPQAPTDNTLQSISKDRLNRYYLNQFNQAFIDKNNHSAPDIEQKLARLDKLAIHYQDKYIASNHFSLGNKDKLLSAGNSPYDATHQKYHPMFNDYLTRFGFYDIFIVDANSGHVVYSVFKELDYATSLLTGPYANSGIATAFKKALQLPDNQQSVLIDFNSYFPSYDQAASFIAAPITDDSGKKNAVMIFQMPIDGINKIMTTDHQWQQVGLGLSGETYLVGPDKTLRSESRFLIEDKENYYQALAQSGEQPHLEQIKAYNSALGLQLVNTSGAADALTGISGFQRFNDYRSVEVLSAYTSINYGDQVWALMAEIDVSEAFADAIKLSDDLYFNALTSLVIICLISITTGLLIAKYLVTPLDVLVQRINDISDGEGDLTVKLSLAKREDEIGAVGKAFNHFVEKIRVIISEIDLHADQLASSSEELSAVTNDTTNIVNLQKAKTDVTTQVMSEFSTSINEIADNSLHTANLTQQANDESSKGANLSEQAQDAIHGLVSSVDIASNELHQLNQQVEQITGILGVIDSIAEQTNLLALNAAIEAARAGESGRGFSVVADEVRTLAAKTQESTVEIQQKIEGLKSSSEKSVFAMSTASQEAEKGISLVQNTATSLRTLSHLIADVSNKNTENATVAKQQSVSVTDVHQNIVDIASYTDNTSSASLQTAQSSSELARLAVNMSGLVQQFKY